MAWFTQKGVERSKEKKNGLERWLKSGLWAVGDSLKELLVDVVAKITLRKMSGGREISLPKSKQTAVSKDFYVVSDVF